MTTIQAIAFGMMLAWTPTLVVVAFLFWAKRVGLEDTDQEWHEPSEPPSSTVT